MTNSFLVLNPHHYPLDLSRIRQSVEQTLKTNKIKQRCRVTVCMVSDQKMAYLHRKYLGLKKTTDVMSFPINELKNPKFQNKMSLNPDKTVELGEIYISFQQASRQAGEFKITIDEEIDKLVEHGVLHLLGIHHE